MEFNPYFDDTEESQEKLFGDLFDFDARQKAIDAGPEAVATFRANRFERFKKHVILGFTAAASTGRLSHLCSDYDAHHYDALVDEQQPHGDADAMGTALDRLMRDQAVNSFNIGKLEPTQLISSDVRLTTSKVNTAEVSE